MPFLSAFSVFKGAFHYEFRMQIRRRAVWITLTLIALVLLGLGSRTPDLQNTLSHLSRFPLLSVLVTWTNAISILLPIGVGVMLADRLPRDRRYKVDELFTAMQGTLSARLIGKYLGTTLATIVPMFLFYLLGVGYITYQTHNILAIPLGLETFAVILLPGLLFISAFSLACPALLWVPLYQFLFVGYWFWGNIFPPGRGIPTLSDTILTPIGGFISAGFYHTGIFDVRGITNIQAIESVIALLGTAVLVLIALWGYLKWEQSHQ